MTVLTVTVCIGGRKTLNLTHASTFLVAQISIRPGGVTCTIVQTFLCNSLIFGSFGLEIN